MRMLFDAEFYGPLSETEERPNIWDQVVVVDTITKRMSFHFIKDLETFGDDLVGIRSMTGSLLSLDECYLMYPKGQVDSRQESMYTATIEELTG